VGLKIVIAVIAAGAFIVAFMVGLDPPAEKKGLTTPPEVAWLSQPETRDRLRAAGYSPTEWEDRINAVQKDFSHFCADALVWSYEEVCWWARDRRAERAANQEEANELADKALQQCRETGWFLKHYFHKFCCEHLVRCGDGV
jgi:hypothetical protein